MARLPDRARVGAGVSASARSQEQESALNEEHDQQPEKKPDERDQPAADRRTRPAADAVSSFLESQRRTREMINPRTLELIEPSWLKVMSGAAAMQQRSTSPLVLRRWRSTMQASLFPGSRRGPSSNSPVNPAQAWRTIFDQYAMFGPDVILQCCAQAFRDRSSRSLRQRANHR
jgi:hypothetical protein